MTPDPAVTVVVPTRHRAASLSRALDALGRQDLPGGDLEVVVVDDGGGEPPMAREAPAGLRVRLLRTSGRGAAAARNAGADAARAPLLIFLDDDVEASPGLVRAHLEAHRRGASLTIGDLPARTEAATGFFAVTLRNWWASMFAEMRRPAHRFTFRDILTGNCAIATGLFRELGGFDASLRCHEDYELGFRAIRAGARVAFCQSAAGVHHETTTLERSLERKRAEGRADVALVRKHPEVLSCLPVGVVVHVRPKEPRGWRGLAFDRPGTAGAVLAGLRRSLEAFEALRMRGRWLRRLYLMLEMAYWQGVAGEVGTRAALEDLARAAAAAPARPAWWLRVDLSEGLAAAAARVDAARADGVVVRYRGNPVGALPPVPGAEPLRGVHLRAAVSDGLAWPLLRALGQSGDAAIEERGGRLAPIACLPREALDLR